METILKWASEYSEPIFFFILLETVILYVLKLVIEQIIKNQFDRQAKQLEFRLQQVSKEFEWILQRRYSFLDRVLLDRYTLIKDIDRRLEVVRINLDRWRKNPSKAQIQIIEGETVLLTDIEADLRLNKAILTEKYYNLLKERYELLRNFWDSDEYSAHIDKYHQLGEQLQNELKEVFLHPEKWIM